MKRAFAFALFCCLAGSLLAQGTGPPVRQEAQEAFRQAMALNKSRDYARALEYFMKAYQADQAILAQDDQGLLDSALNHLKEQLVASPNDVNHCFQLAEVLKLKGLTDEALQYYRKVVDLDRNTPLATLAEGEIRAIEALAPATPSPTTTAPAGVVPPPVAPVAPAAPQADPQVVQELREAVETLQQRVQELETELAAEKERASTESEDTEKLKKEHEELKKKAETWKLYYHLYFSNPANVQNLRNQRSY